METVVKTRGVIGADGHILPEEMPFRQGESVEVVVWPSVAGGISSRKQGGIVESLQELAEWTRQRYPDAKPLSDEALSRESIYQD